MANGAMMSFSATRLTCFALLSAIEDDLRSNIDSNFGQDGLDALLSEEKIEQAQERRRREGLAATANLSGLLPYLDFGDGYELLMGRRRDLPPALRDALASISDRIERVIDIRNRVAHTRPMEIDDTAFLLDTAAELRSPASSGQWESVDETIRRLEKEPSYVLGLTVNLRSDPDTAPQHNLPVPDFDETGFFGRREELRRIKKALKGAYPVVSVLGDGGIGKTSIALKAAYELLDDDTAPFEAFVWVTAKATILTTNEIQRINGAIESSLGLFAQAANELGAGNSTNPIDEVLAYLENFKILLILDNLETVLDDRLRQFLLDLPLGSKVLVTSRVGLGIENPVKLEPLTQDESARLIWALARVRNVQQLKSLSDVAIRNLAVKMDGHPAYIKWFVAGVQSGRRPEELIGDNALLLDYCMSNVYEYLEEPARAVIRSMQVLPGPRNQAELAFLNDFDSERVQAALLQLLTTNFAGMSSRSFGPALDTIYQLSDFARQYLDKHHPVLQAEREWLIGKNEELRDMSSRLTADSTAAPYATSTVHIRGIGDVHVARILKDAIRSADRDPGVGLSQCREAQGLAPSYYEGWRVEAYVRAMNREHVAAITAYDRALELAPDSPVLLFHYGTFLLNEAGDPRGALPLLQMSAKMDKEAPNIVAQVAWSHYCLGDMMATIDSSRHLIAMENARKDEQAGAVVLALRAAAKGIEYYEGLRMVERAAELLETAVELAESSSVELLGGEAFDRIGDLRRLASGLERASDAYLAGKAVEHGGRLAERQRCYDAEMAGRLVGMLKSVFPEKGFGFITADRDYFFHYRDLISPRDWDMLEVGMRCALDPVRDSPRGPRAVQVRALP